MFLLSLGTAHSQSAPSPLLLSRGRTEPIVAVDPRNPSIIVVGANTNYDAPVGGRYPVAFFTSHNGGRSFLGGTVPLPPGYVTAADPAVTIAESGTVFFSFLAESPSYCSSAGRSAVVVAISTDGGRSFPRTSIVSVDPANDKPFMTVQSVRGGKARVFVTWTRFFKNSSQVVVSRSLDGGASFGRPLSLYTSTRDNSGSVPLADRQGRVYVLWASAADNGLSRTGPARVLLRISQDNGAHYGPLRAAGPTFTSIPRMAAPDSLRNLTLPAAAVGRDGTIYVAWAQVSHDYGHGSVSSDIVLTRSTDGGHSWARARRVNDARVHDRFMPALSVFRDGTVGIAFYDRRRSPQDLGVYATRVRWGPSDRVRANVRLNSPVSPASSIFYIRPGSTCLSPGRFFGDYIGAAAGPHGTLNVAWADGSGASGAQTNIWFDGMHFSGR